MSGKASSGKGAKSGGGGATSTQQGNQSAAPPTIVSGWQYHQYARNSDRYVYIGKDEDTGEPEFLDYGPRGGGGR